MILRITDNTDLRIEDWLPFLKNGLECIRTEGRCKMAGFWASVAVATVVVVVVKTILWVREDRLQKRILAFLETEEGQLSDLAEITSEVIPAGKKMYRDQVRVEESLNTLLDKKKIWYNCDYGYSVVKKED